MKRLNFIIPILAAVSALCAVRFTGPVALGEVIGQKKGKAGPKPLPVSPVVQSGKWTSNCLEIYALRVGEYISHTTPRERLVAD